MNSHTNSRVNSHAAQEAKVQGVPEATTAAATAGGPASTRNAIANAVATAVAIAGAIAASPAAMEKLPAGVGSILRTTATCGSTAQPFIVTVVGIVVAAMTRPPCWLAGAMTGLRRRVHL